MKILDLKKVTIILVTMLLFLSMQISVFASDNCTVVKIPVKQLFDSEVEGIADEFSYIMTTDQSDAPMPAGGRNMQYSWTMKKNAATEITLNVKTAGQYHYTLCQTTEKKDNYKYMGGYNSGLTAFTTMINLIVIIVGGFCITRGIVNVTDMITFLLYINIFTDPIKTLIDFTEQFQNGYSGFERFLEILEIEPDIKDNADAIELNDVKGNIKFNDVSFKYNDSSHRVLKYISLAVKAGSYVALVGSSGAGKTTLCNLIPRFYEATSGKITIDGKDIKDIKLKDLRDNIGIVQQDVYLFVGTVYDNIRYGRPDATREEVIAAAKEANAYDFIMSLPNGFETDIGQRGIKLSGGQKQRISIARVFLKNPPILIFDEATSALDNESEKIVQESMEKLAKNRTTMVIAHRLSTIRNAEKILVLTDKGIEEQGTHKELMDKHGIYYDLYNVIEK